MDCDFFFWPLFVRVPYISKRVKSVADHIERRTDSNPEAGTSGCPRRAPGCKHSRKSHADVTGFIPRWLRYLRVRKPLKANTFSLFHSVASVPISSSASTAQQGGFKSCLAGWVWTPSPQALFLCIRPLEHMHDRHLRFSTCLGLCPGPPTCPATPRSPTWSAALCVHTALTPHVQTQCGQAAPAPGGSAPGWPDLQSWPSNLSQLRNQRIPGATTDC